MPQRAIIAQLEHKNKKFLPENLDVYFDAETITSSEIAEIFEDTH